MLTSFKAQAELDKRGKVEEPAGKVEAVKSCDNCGDRVCFQYRQVNDLSMVPCNNWIPKAKPTKQPKIEPLPRVAQLEDVRDKLNELINAVNTVERRGK
jgi:hypothetical protein